MTTPDDIVPAVARQPGLDAPAVASGKIFAAGLARTGTTSLYQALRILGINAAPSAAELVHGWAPGSPGRVLLDRYDAFLDNPVPFVFRRLAAEFDRSRHVVTWRPEEEWLRSMQWLFGPGLDRLEPDLRRLGDLVHRQVYGTDVFDRTVLRAVHRRHYAELEEWSRGRDDVLWLDLTRPLDWGPLCAFLERPIPAHPFPHANRAAGGYRSRVAARLGLRGR